MSSLSIPGPCPLCRGIHLRAIVEVGGDDAEPDLWQCLDCGRLTRPDGFPKRDVVDRESEPEHRVPEREVR